MGELSRWWEVITGAERRRARQEWRAEWCRIRVDDAGVEIRVDERPVWSDRVRWDEILAVGLEREGLLGPGLYIFMEREPGVVWASPEGEGADALRNELQRRGVSFRPLPELWLDLDLRLQEQARDLVRRDFPPAEWPLIDAELDSHRGHLAGRVHVAIVRLARGQLARVRALSEEVRRGGDVVTRDIVENMSPGSPERGSETS